MIRINFSKLVAVFALIIALGGSLPATAAPRTADGPSVTLTDIALPIAWLRSLLTSAWTKGANEGCRIDPNGCRHGNNPRLLQSAADESKQPQVSSAPSQGE